MSPASRHAPAPTRAQVLSSTRVPARVIRFVLVPIVRDQVAEPTESMRLALTDRHAEPLPDSPVLTGTVLDKP
ncbi:hypothetical protein PV726_07545 [Streptomyces europaeiscabiei]|uniref:hypothetical protein n=1 Tax=Streptomyces europaeiscabiei TaxID=146819 RepID=UPI0029AEE441|nr:hypothetical protein [Streptomyces europaeiscabiei]MDX3690182.1 hypothetical protein [Streptomyces europaeiscabiei]